MTGPLALVGGAEWSDGCTFDSGLLEAAGTDEVVVLPTGSAYEGPHLLVERAEAWFGSLGARVVEAPVLRRPDAFVESNVQIVRDARFVYLAGASAMHLRSVVLDTPLWAAIVAAWQDGAVLAGSAAGADVLCEPMVDPRGGAFTTGLGLLVGLSVIPRSNTWSPEKVQRTVKLAPAGVAVAEVPEASALLWDATSGWRAAGVGEVTVHVDGAEAGLDALPDPSAFA